MGRQQALTPIVGSTILIGLAGAALWLSQSASTQQVQVTALAATGSLSAVALAWLAIDMGMGRRRKRRLSRLREFIESEPAFCFVCDPGGHMLHANAAARPIFIEVAVFLKLTLQCRKYGITPFVQAAIIIFVFKFRNHNPVNNPLRH